jgi:hypothetical protein
MVHLHFSRPARLLFLVLLVSFFLRVLLIIAGGQFYLPDESRYIRSRMVVDAALSGDMPGIFKPLRTANHLAYAVIGVVPATIERAISPNPRIPALFFCLFGILNLWLIWKISLRMGARHSEALTAAFLLSVSTTFFYYCRHLVPYDLSMTFGLLALFVALKRPSSLRHSCQCGLLSSVSFLAYNGHWTLVAFTLLAHVIYSARSLRQAARRAAVFGIAFGAPILAITSLDALFGGNMLLQFIWFSRTVKQGSFSEGWSLPFEYLWHAEHCVLLLWIVAFVYCFWSAFRGALTSQAAIGMAGLLFIYGTLVLFSVGFDKFVVYGRLVRQCVPFLCLLTAHWLEWLRNSSVIGKKPLAILYVLIVLQAGANFYRPFVQVFPSEFRRQAQEIFTIKEGGQYDLINVKYIYPEPEMTPLQPHRILLRAPHPAEFLPYQFEGFTPEQREKLRSTDISMRLIVYSDG